MACVSKPCPEGSREPFATLRDSTARFLSANGINKTIKELNRLFNVVGIPQSPNGLASRETQR
ncbi:hypothetical protein Lnau_2876 [Legionella nautarum]|uniref:Uncharacterized protein n=1 Tax=Legionella nautarum TaxID=45070 RepID=A0A0W0WLM1_9GAMM|nr:hypothetical protein Lnau_2876 [Legionella nautarum]